MEPMDLDEDSMGETPKRFTRSALVPAFPHGIASAPCFSPGPVTPSLWTQQPDSAQHTLPSRPQSALTMPSSTSTPVLKQYGHVGMNHLVHTTTGIVNSTGDCMLKGVNYGTPKTVAVRDQSMTLGRNSPLMGFYPVGETFHRHSTPVNTTAGNYRPDSVQDGGLVSPDTSGASDVSEMDVGQCSLSPSWDRMVSAFQSINVFKSISGMDHSIPTEKQTVGENKPLSEVHENAGTGNVSWEPSITAVQAATIFKRKNSETKRSSSKTKVASATENVTRDQRPSTPLRKLGKRDRVSDSAGTSEISAGKGPKSDKDIKSNRGQKAGCWRCLKLFTVLIVVAAGVFAFLHQKHVVERRDRYANVDAELLRNEMASKLFGQHIAMQVVPWAVEDYLENFRGQDKHCLAVPPLVLSFHGWTGVGKNFVSDIITSVFSLKTVTKFLVPYHFPHQHLDDLYRKQIEEWVLSNITEYSVNIVVFDEMDKATSGVVEGLKNTISEVKKRDAQHSPVIVLLLSNSLGSEINRRVFQAMSDGLQRESLTDSDFAALFVSCNDAWYKQLRSSSIITKSVPFLPLEKQHIIQCIRRDLVSKKLSTQSEIISRVLNELTFTTLSSGHQFSQTGCKRVADKVDYVTFE